MRGKRKGESTDRLEILDTIYSWPSLFLGGGGGGRRGERKGGGGKNHLFTRVMDDDD